MIIEIKAASSIYGVQAVKAFRHISIKDITFYSASISISKLAFVSKLLEKVALNQLQAFLVQNEIFENVQSGFRSNHSAEPASMTVLNDILFAIDSGSSVVLVLLDISAAFDTRSQYPSLSLRKDSGNSGHGT